MLNINVDSVLGLTGPPEPFDYKHPQLALALYGVTSHVMYCLTITLVYSMQGAIFNHVIVVGHAENKAKKMVWGQATTDKLLTHAIRL